MGLFGSKNSGNLQYDKHFINVIKNTGEGDFLIWRQPEEDFNTNSKLIVMPGETAIFVDGGNVVQTFDEGTYQLSTNNYPFISRLKNTISGGVSTFNCVIYFFRKADSKEIKWGTDRPINVRDKVFGILTDVKARGVYKVRITNPVLFLEKMVGNNIRYQEQTDLDDYFNSQMMTKTKSVVTKFLNNYQNEFIGIEQYLDEISEQLMPQINEMMSEYGLQCVNFSIMALDVNTDKYNNIDQAQIDSVKMMKRATGEQVYMQTLGNNWDKMQSAKILSELAQNEGAGNFTSIGAGLSAGMFAGNAFGQMAQQMVMPGQNSTDAVNKTDSEEDPMDTLIKLKKMLEADLISQDEYDEKKKQILARL